MYIILDPGGLDETYLAGHATDDALSGLASGLEVGEQRVVQVAEGARWEDAGVFDRLNRRTDISFTSRKTFADCAAAEAFALAIGESAPGGEYEIQFREKRVGVGGGYEKKVTGIVTGARILSHTGVTVRVRYNIIAGGSVVDA